MRGDEKVIEGLGSGDDGGEVGVGGEEGGVERMEMGFDVGTEKV